MARRLTSRSAERGYSLIELMVALTVIGVIAALAVPAGRGLFPGLELRAAAEALAGEARAARREAMRGARDGWVELDVETRRYRRAGEDWTALPEEAELSLVTARREQTGARSGRIRFYPDGASTGGALTLSAAGRRMEVSVDWLTGAVRLSEEDAG